jgi:hypothetical protein
MVAGLARGRTLLLAASLALALVGGSLCWRVQSLDDPGGPPPSLLHRTHDYFIAGYLLLWLCNGHTARVRGCAGGRAPSAGDARPLIGRRCVCVYAQAQALAHSYLGTLQSFGLGLYFMVRWAMGGGTRAGRRPPDRPCCPGGRCPLALPAS